jgi:hypothetical protein
MADAGVELHILERVAGHQDPAVISGYLHPDVQAMFDVGAAFSALVVPSGPKKAPQTSLWSGGPGRTREWGPTCMNRSGPRKSG